MKKTSKDIVKAQMSDYGKSLSSIIKKVDESKHRAITTVNKLLIEVYWFIGETIINLQEKGSWGDGVVEKLSQDLRMKYPEQSGFSARNLWDCKRFYLSYKGYTKLRTLSAEISWSNNVISSNWNRLSVNFFSVAYPDNKNGFGSLIRFINDSIVAVSERVASFFLTFKRFAGIRICRERIYAF